ncbi:MAG: hypothetical protein HY760_03880 [Nitrospirae bacterium]|nr:hypothetical protein [Nitrospirota bacterium]
MGFSARQNYLAARLSNPEFVNVFLGRLNAVVKDNGLGDGTFVGEKVTLATQRAIDGAKRQETGIRTRLIGASIRDGGQVVSLAGLDVLTIPPGALQEFLAMIKGRGSGRLLQGPWGPPLSSVHGGRTGRRPEAGKDSEIGRLG